MSNSYKNTDVGNGTATDYAVGFAFISEADIRVIQNGVLKARGTDYNVQNPTSGATALIHFAAAPTNGHTLKFYRNTPIALPTKNPTISHLAALAALYRAQERAEETRDLGFLINATDLAAGTAQSLVAPCDGYIEVLRSEVIEAVTTGGAITVEVEGVAVTGLSITVADAAPVGKVQEDTPTTAQSATTKVRRGQTITVTPAAAFATAGAVKGYVRMTPADL